MTRVTSRHQLYVTPGGEPGARSVVVLCQVGECGYRQAVDTVQVDQLMSMQARHQRAQEENRG